MIFQKIKKNNNGFVILLAVTLSSILLAIALGVSNIALKEINFSTSAKNTNDAFVSADIGAECALYNDKSTVNKFPYPAPDPFSASPINSCAGLTPTPTGSRTATTASYDFIITGLGSLGQGCVKVNVFKDNNTPPLATTITSKGYNIGDPSCNSTNPNRTERELKVTYGGSGVASPQCSDSFDNDGDSLIDYPADPGCSDASDNNETNIPPPPSSPTYVRSGGATGISFSFDIGTAGTNRLVVVMADAEGQGLDSTGATVSGNSCVPVASADNTQGVGNHSEMFYCDEDNLGSSAGVVTVAVSTGGGNWAVHAHLYTEASQSGPSDSGINQTAVGGSTVSVSGIDVPENGLVVMNAGNGASGTWNSWTSPLTERTDGPNPGSAVFGTSSGIESTIQTGKTYTATASVSDIFRGTGIVGVWGGAAPPPPPPTTYNLTVTKSGTGSGTVTSSPSGINCGSDCSETYTDGTAVSLTATPAGGSTFAGWSGACSGTGACNLTMSTTRNVTATFNVIPPPPSGYQYVKFNVTTTFTEPTSGCTQISEFTLLSGGSVVSWPAGKSAYYETVGNNNPNEGPDKTVDGLLTNKLCDLNATGSTAMSIVVNAGAPLTFDGYKYGTANDAPGRDPVSWTVEGSTDGISWTVLDTRTNQTDPVIGNSSARNSYTQNFSFAATGAVPTVTTPTVSSITSSGATLGANVTSLGSPASISARGTCWGTSPNPTSNCTAQGGTTTGVFTHARTGMSANTFYYYRGYATNTTGTGYSADGTFTTAQIVANDTFTQASNVTLASHIPTGAGAGTSWVAQVTGANVTNRSTGVIADSTGSNGNRYKMNNNLGSSQMDVQADFTSSGSSGSFIFFGLLARLPASTGTSTIEGSYDHAVAGGSWVIGDGTSSASTAEAWPGGTVNMKLEIRTGVARLYANGVLKVTLNTNLFSGNNYAGIFLGNFSGTSGKVTADNYLSTGF